MPHHEEKICPRCGTLFECKVGSVVLCQCSAIDLSEEQRTYVMNNYDDCLCAGCLRELRAESSGFAGALG
ncbi:MAG: cysteine-rich CWC family protein [Gammaproteobacteria bacterium]